jgi:nucleoside 2-deoxyribosyltransferase
MFYVAHRLFAGHDRQLGALIAIELAARVGAHNVFLPFCDTDEEELQANLKGRSLFALDCKRLERLDAMIAVLHGPSLDDGVCMEIGYAAALGAPIIALTTDFQTYGLAETGPSLAFPDPLLEAVVTEVVRVDRLGAAPLGLRDRFRAFEQRNSAQIHNAINVSVSRVLYHASAQPVYRPQPTRASRAAFCEPSRYRRDETWESALAALRTSPFSVRQAIRHQPCDNPIAAARADWNALRACDLLLVDVNGPECPPGAALMIGASVPVGRRVIAVQSAPTWTFAHGREPNWRNLMVQYSVDTRVTEVDAIQTLLS